MAGRTRLGCLVLLVLAVTGVYFGVDAAAVYWRYYRYRDAVAQETRYGTTRSNEDIRRRLMAVADSLGLPEEANRRLQVRRSANRLVVETSYTELVELPFYRREVTFTPQAELRF